MSADNGIYVAQFPDGYRVIEAQAIENLWWNNEKEQEQQEPYPRAVKEYYEHAPVWATKEEAYSYAAGLLETSEWGFEYGIQYLGELPWWGKEETN